MVNKYFTSCTESKKADKGDHQTIVHIGGKKTQAASSDYMLTLGNRSTWTISVFRDLYHVH